VVLSNILVAVIGLAMLAWSGVSVADQYRPDEFFGLDLARVALSPKPLGPAAAFAPGPLDVVLDRGGNALQARAGSAGETKLEAKTPSRIVVHNVRRPPVEQPANSTRTKLARHHLNPLDAKAFDQRIQAWPCKSGGICNWKR